MRDVPLEMRSRQFRIICDWYKKFDIYLYESTTALGYRAGANEYLMLDLCCSCGVTAETLAKELDFFEVTNIGVIGFDQSMDLFLVQKNLDMKSLLPRLVGNVLCELSLPSEPIDLIYCMTGLAYIPDSIAVLRESARVLKGNSSGFFYLLKGIKDISFNQIFETLCQCSTGLEFESKRFNSEWKDKCSRNEGRPPYYLVSLDRDVLIMTKMTFEYFFNIEFLSALPLISLSQRSSEKYLQSSLYKIKTDVPVGPSAL